jgi:hypothetical protein
VTFHSQFMSQIDILMTHHSSLDHAVSAGLKFPAFNPVHVPMTYTPPSAAVAAASANALDKAVEKIHNVAFIASNCGWWRDVIVAGVMQHLEVNSMGNCLQNAPSIPSASYSLPGSAKTQVDLKSYYTLFICFYSRNLAFIQALAQFKFVLSIENARTLDYVTEKFWQPLLAGAAQIGACVPLRNHFYTVHQVVCPCTSAPPTSMTLRPVVPSSTPTI